MSITFLIWEDPPKEKHVAPNKPGARWYLQKEDWNGNGKAHSGSQICIIRIMENSGDVYCKQRNQEATAMYLQK